MDAKDIALIKALGGGGSGGSGGSITVDSALSDTSTNPVQNRVVKSALDAKLAKSGIAAKTEAMTQEVGLDAAGALWAEPGGGGGQAVDKIAIKITETVHSIALLDDITLYNRIRANIKVVGDSANAASSVLGAITPSGMLVNYVLNATKMSTGYLFFDLRLSEQGAESDVTINFANQAYSTAALSHLYGMDRKRWTGVLSLAPKDADWNFGAGTEIYLEAYRA